MITAKIITDSIANNIRLTTMELNYPRFIHSEFMTHRMFSRNASSSRAIPIEKMIASVEASPAMPIHWGKNQPGMQAREELDEANKDLALTHWEWASYYARQQATNLNYIGLHKQVVNRLLEPFQYIKVIVTATEWDNFFKLRLHPDAQPEIAFLASKMQEAMDGSTPTELEYGEWHLPYVEISKYNLDLSANGINKTCLDYPVAIKCSVARCARVSYLNHDASEPNVEKDIALYDRLLKDGHLSPFEHQATPIPAIVYQNRFEYDLEWIQGITHKDRNDNYWSGNFRGFLQHRQML